MRGGRRSAILIGLVLWNSIAFPIIAHARSASVTATAAILIDRQSGQILWQRNLDLPLPPASTTKIVTALLALQSGRLDDSFVVSANAAQAAPSKISVRQGWRLRLRDLLYAILLNSANDASVVAAEGLGGSVDGFAAQMNTAVRTLGATHSHFVNPNGLPAANHYSTVRDLTTIFNAGLRWSLFRQVLETKRIVITPTAGSTRPIALHSHNRLLMSDYEIHVIGKTGWTIAAKKCFVGVASSGDRELLVAVLGSRDLWGDVKRLIDSGFRTETGGPTLVSNDVDWQLAAEDPVPQAAGDAEEPTQLEPPRTVTYDIRVASFRGTDSATRLRSSLTKSGYHATVSRAGTGRKLRYHVTVGSYQTLKQAQAVARKLSRTHRVKPVVLKSSI